MKRLIIAASVLVGFVLLGVGIWSNKNGYTEASNVNKQNEYYDKNNTKNGVDSMIATKTNVVKETEFLAELAKQIDTNIGSTYLFVNKEYSLPEDYVPEDLVVPNILYSFNYYHEKKLMREVVAEPLEQLFDSASDSNLTLYGVSGYRSYNRQKEIYESNLRSMGLNHTEQYSAKPGFSEHQTGLSIDVSTSSIGNRLDETFAGTPEGKWLATHAHEFGFIIRYPKDKTDITGYAYEPWHIRYVGIELATHLYKNSLTLEEFYNYKPSKKVAKEIAKDNLIDLDTPDATPMPTPIYQPTRTVSPTQVPIARTTPAPTNIPEPAPTKETNGMILEEVDNNKQELSNIPINSSKETSTNEPLSKPVQTEKPVETPQPEQPQRTEQPKKTEQPIQTEEPIKTPKPEPTEESLETPQYTTTPEVPSDWMEEESVPETPIIPEEPKNIPSEEPLEESDMNTFDIAEY